MRRALGIASGIVTHLLFAATVWKLYPFLQGAAAARSGPPQWHASAGALSIDLLLALQFALVHSALLLPAVRSRLERRIPSAFYGLFFCTATCLGLTLIFWQWRTSAVVVWRATGAAAVAVEMAFAASWLCLFYSLWLSGLGYQTGWTSWRFWMAGQSPPRRKFRPRSAYLIMRHPVYLSFLGLIWFVPTVTLDRALLIAVWTAYVFVGSYLKDRRLQYYLGPTYREYQARVPGYPGMIAGPLARIPWGESGAAN
jgi:protein-S-isoprenylcysteine O-methyltransferase Ste14